MTSMPLPCVFRKVIPYQGALRWRIAQPDQSCQGRGLSTQRSYLNRPSTNPRVNGRK